MDAAGPRPLPETSPSITLCLEERLERGEIVVYPECPFAVPGAEDRAFLCEQRLAGRVHKNVSFDPETGTVAGFARASQDQEDCLRRVLAEFARSATGWLGTAVPRYRLTWRPDRVSYRPLEDATRSLRLRARNDLLHIDAFPTRPSHGWRILRLFVNLHSCEPRVWATSATFARLLERYGAAVGLPGRGRGRHWAGRLLRSFPALPRPGRPARSPYDAFMLRLHHFLKADDEFQERAAKRVWTFPPGSLWLAMTDGVSHAMLRGRQDLDHSYFIAPESLAVPDESPASLLVRACRVPDGRAA